MDNSKLPPEQLEVAFIKRLSILMKVDEALTGMAQGFSEGMLQLALIKFQNEHLRQSLHPNAY